MSIPELKPVRMLVSGDGKIWTEREVAFKDGKYFYTVYNLGNGYFQIWNYAKPIPEKTKRPMTDEEIFIALDNGAKLKHEIKSKGADPSYLNDFRSSFEKIFLTISHDWKEKGLKDATWQPLEVEE